ncbi:MAG: DNA gyrase subunit A, partial [Planctomycetes bacterium]|nr:DNA gyrase subunit A [Planctomycetota bacterium]
RTAQGRSIRNLIEGIEPDEEIRSIRATRDFTEADFLLFATANGKVKKTELKQYSRPRRAGIIATKLEEGDRLVGMRLVSEGDEVLVCTASGQVIRFAESDARPMGRNAAGVKGARLKEGDKVVSLVVGTEEEKLLIACAHGYGKRTRIGEFRLTKRGSQGVVGIRTTERNGLVVNALNASRCDDVLFMTSGGMIVRTDVEDISEQGRATQGVRLVNLKKADQLVRMAPVVRDEEEEGQAKEGEDSPEQNDE